jgi:hypothetical protein
VEISKFKLFADPFASDCIASKWINSSYQLHHQQQLAEKVLIQTFDALDQLQQEAEESTCHWFALMEKRRIRTRFRAIPDAFCFKKVIGKNKMHLCQL